MRARNSWFCHPASGNLGQMNDPIAEMVRCCTCIFCARHTDADTEADLTRTTPRSPPRRQVRRSESLPATSSIMDVLYPSSYLGTPPGFADPPSYYFPGDSLPSTARGNYRERTEGTPPISPTTTTAGGTLVASGYHDPLAVEALPLPGVPSPETSLRRVPLAQPNPPVVALDIDVLQEAEPPPPYSHFDESRSHHPVPSDALGPYPHISVLSPRAR